jgi:hypothetical protein
VAQGECEAILVDVTAASWGGMDAVRARADRPRALTVHKSQGQTLERVRVDLGNAFTDGMRLP